MNKPEPTIRESYWLSRYTWLMIALWTAIVGALFLFNFMSIKKEFSALARLETLASFNKDVVYRRWATIHGGVYVPVTNKTPPNIYLNVPERDISTPSGKKLTLVNPAYMTRQAHELGKEQYGLQGHITSLKPLNPGNVPDAWETEALKSFEQGKKQVTSVEQMDGKPHFRLIRPFITEEGCLKCHAHQGYKVGDIRGGISLAVPMQPFYAAAHRRIFQIAIGLALLWILGAGGLWVGMGHIRNRIREKEEAEQERNRYVEELQEALEEVKQLSGFIPICSHCKQIRDDKGYWNQIESYISAHSEALFSHSICPDCAKKLYPEFDLYPEKNEDS